MVAQLGALATGDDDRYVCAAAVEGLRRVAPRRDPPEMAEAGRRLACAGAVLSYDRDEHTVVVKLLTHLQK